MSTTNESYTSLAPDVEKAWVEDFVLEQRLLGVPGHRIGDALAVVQSHVSESGESAHEAFGDPTAYARESGPARPAESPGWGWLLGIGLGLAGLMLTTVGAGAWISGERTLDVSAGLLVSMFLAVAAYAGVVARTEAVLRLAVGRLWPAVALAVLWMLVVVGVVLLLDAPLFGVPASVAVGAGVALLVAGTALEWRTHAGGGLEDPIVGPGEAGVRRSTERFTWLTVFLFPVLTLLVVGLSWALSLLS